MGIPGTHAFKVPGFRVPVDGGRRTAIVRLTLGSSQMIANPQHSITQRLDNAAVLQATADLRGWYTGNSEVEKKILKELEAEYAANYFPIEGQTGSLWWSANNGLLWGFTLAGKRQYAAKTWNDVAPALIERGSGLAVVIGMYMGDKCWEEASGNITVAMRDAPTVADRILKDMLSSQKDFYTWLVSGLKLLDMVSMNADSAGNKNMEIFKAMIALFGGCDECAQSQRLEADYISKQITDVVTGLLKVPAFQKGLREGSNLYLPIGDKYTQWYSEFIYHLNSTVLAKYEGEQGNLFETGKLYFLDVLCIPGFGQAVAQGWTVWSYAQTYFWINAIFAGFADVVQRHNPSIGLAYHLECTELLSFLDMLQDGGAFVVGNVNYMYLASLGSGCPLQFTPYVGEASPAAIMCLHENEREGVKAPSTKYFRRKDVPVRSPAMDGKVYAAYRNLMYPPGSQTRKAFRWANVVQVNGLLGDQELVAKPKLMHPTGDSMVVASTHLLVNYFPPGGLIQYAGEARFAERAA